MTDVPLAYQERLNIREEIARIDRNRADIQKLLAEHSKLNAEQSKLAAEGRKFNLDWWIVPATVLGAIVAGAVARLPEILHAFGFIHETRGLACEGRALGGTERVNDFDTATFGI
jgi:hypothetical protein